MAKAIKLKLKVGDIAPDFEVVDSNGKMVSLATWEGKSVALYFYPKDDTPGCTKEACAFRDNFAALKRKGVVVVGVSPDSQKSHDKFAAKFKLPFVLLPDVERKIVTAYGVWGEKMFMGRKYQGVHRVTFLIGPERRIEKILADCKPDEHASAILAAV